MTLEKARHGTHLSGAYFEVADGGVLLRVEIDDLRWMAASLAGLGVPLVIHQPPELRTALHEYALALAHEAERIAP